MKRLILIGRVAAGKTSLTQALKGEHSRFHKVGLQNGEGGLKTHNAHRAALQTA